MHFKAFVNKKAEKSKDNCEIALCYDNFIITVPKNIRPKFGNTVSVNYARMTKLEIGRKRDASKMVRPVFVLKGSRENRL